ncbi:MAG: hypothetical protein ACYTGZ_04105 [Planctomycetota bacterium]|jgi:hypothetical protein
MSVKRMLCLIATVAILSLTAETAPGKGGGNNNPPPATIEFDDLAGDAIQSDGNGPYDVSVESDDYETILSFTKKQEIWFDYSDCDPVEGLSCEGPFGPDATSDHVGGATIHIPTPRNGVGVTDSVGIAFYFQTAEGRWKLQTIADVTPYDDDDDGAIDRLVIEHYGTSSSKFFEGIGQRRGPGGFTFLEHGRFFMPWGAEILIP